MRPRGLNIKENSGEKNFTDPKKLAEIKIIIQKNVGLSTVKLIEMIQTNPEYINVSESAIRLLIQIIKDQSSQSASVTNKKI